MANQTIVLDRLKMNGRLCQLARELRITVEHDADRLTLSNEEFGLLVSAPTLEEGIAGISDELSTLWEVYVAENPANLTGMHTISVPISNPLMLPEPFPEILQDPGNHDCSSQERVRREVTPSQDLLPPR